MLRPRGQPVYYAKMARHTSKKQIWDKILKRINKNRLDYILVGAAAMAVYGIPRTTLDIDIYIAANKGALKRLFKFAAGLGLQTKQKDILSIKVSPKLLAGQWICFSYRGQDILDVFLAPEDEFKALKRNSELKQDKTLSLRVAALEDIVKMKKASGRPIDLTDIRLIEESRKICLPECRNFFSYTSGSRRTS
jgi:hypothetical protein